MHRLMDDTSSKPFFSSKSQMASPQKSTPATPLITQPQAPAEPMPDVLTDVLDELRLRAIVSGRSTHVGSWAMKVPDTDGAFYALLDGTAMLEAQGIPQPLRLEAGDLVVLPHGRAHQLRDMQSRPTGGVVQPPR